MNPQKILLKQKEKEEKEYIKKIEDFTAMVFEKASKENLSIFDIKNVISFMQQRMESAVNKMILKDLINYKPTKETKEIGFK